MSCGVGNKGARLAREATAADPYLPDDLPVGSSAFDECRDARILLS